MLRQLNIIPFIILDFLHLESRKHADYVIKSPRRRRVSNETKSFFSSSGSSQGSIHGVVYLIVGVNLFFLVNLRLC